MLVLETMLGSIPEAMHALPAQGFPLKKIVKYAAAKGFTDLIVFNEDRKKINGLLLVHLPAGPTAHFKLSSLVLSKDIKVRLDEACMSCQGGRPAMQTCSCALYAVRKVVPVTLAGPWVHAMCKATSGAVHFLLRTLVHDQVTHPIVMIAGPRAGGAREAGAGAEQLWDAAGAPHGAAAGLAVPPGPQLPQPPGGHLPQPARLHLLQVRGCRHAAGAVLPAWLLALVTSGLFWLCKRCCAGSVLACAPAWLLRSGNPAT